MKRIILITIICFLIPCFGFAKGPVTISSIEGTLWRARLFEVGNYPDVQAFHVGPKVFMMGFHDDKVYTCNFLFVDGDTCELTEDTSLYYIDFPFISMVYYFSIGPDAHGTAISLNLGIMLRPIGVGYLTLFECAFCGPRDALLSKFCCRFLTGIMEEENDNWTP